MTERNNSIIKIGIDLGTTNSSIAVNIKGKIEIIKKPGGLEYTPSVFGFDKKGNKIIGQKAYEYLYKFSSNEEYKNFKAEVKRVMGTPQKKFFERAKIEMSPEEISAEILKSLKEDVLRKYPDFDTTAVVITIPAAFSVLQSEATKKAGNLAGFKHVVLLQEPIAAGASYGFQNAENENWLIYDFGGGTFDVALISCKDGILSVLGHNGDNFLGGKNIDWRIVDTIIIPKIKEKYKLTNFTRSNEKYSSVFSNLKYIAESAKIELSQYEKTTIALENIGKDESDEEISLSFTFTRSELEEIIKPIIDRTIEFTNQTLKEAGMKNTSTKRIILVGGPTQIPYLKTKLENDLKIHVDSSVDPLTVVSHGACIFGMSQKIPKEFLSTETQKIKGAKIISINHSSLTADTEEPVSGTIENLDDSEQYYIQIQSDNGTFTGAKTKINNGKFYYTVNIEPNKQNLFWIYVFDEQGTPVKLTSDSFTIMHGLAVSGAPIPHSISVVIASRDSLSQKIMDVCDRIFEKGSPLPLKKTLDVYKTSRILKRGEDSSLNIDIVEGESQIPDRNAYVCKLGIEGKDLPYDLPEGTPVEIIIEYDESREITVTAYIPLIDMTLNARRTEKDEVLHSDKILEELEAQRSRAKTTVEDVSSDESKKIKDMISSIEHGIINANTDEDEKRKSNKQLKDLKILLDKIDEESSIPKLIKEFNDLINSVKEKIQDYASAEDKDDLEKRLENLKSEGEIAIKTENKVLLIRINEQLDSLENKILFSNFDWCVQYFKYIMSLGEDGKFSSEKEAQYYISKARKAIQDEDIDELKRCTVELKNLLPTNGHPDKYAGLTR